MAGQSVGAAGKEKLIVLEKRNAYWTCDDDGSGEPLYYFAPNDRRPPPYGTQREVTAIIDIADDGTIAGVELIYDMPPAPKPIKSDFGNGDESP